jgi:flavin-dependent dehydrogenase
MGPRACGNVGSRRLATNHYTGRGYWVWVIPLGNGETSIGVVFDKRMHRLHEGTDRQADYVAFLRANPVLRELLEGAEVRTEDVRSLSRLAYCARQYMGRGWALLGDSAAFLDPYYSPGLDHAAFTAEATAEVIQMDAMGKDLCARIDEHNDLFLRSYHRFFKAAYRDKYAYMGEQDLLSASFLLDTAQYYLFLVIPAYRFLGRFRWEPVLGPRAALISYWFMRAYTSRFKAIAELRRETGEEGRRNDGRRIRAFYNLGLAPIHMDLRGVKLWFWAELDALRLRVKKWLGRGRRTTAAEPMKGEAAAAR